MGDMHQDRDKLFTINDIPKSGKDEVVLSVEPHEASPFADRRTCKSCNQPKQLSEFPKKGDGRYESNCKPCHNEIIKARRQKRKPTKPAAWSIKSVPCKVEFTTNNVNTFVDVLYQLLKSEGLANVPEETPTIDSLINRTSYLEVLKQKKGDSI